MNNSYKIDFHKNGGLVEVEMNFGIKERHQETIK